MQNQRVFIMPALFEDHFHIRQAHRIGNLHLVELLIAVINKISVLAALFDGVQRLVRLLVELAELGALVRNEDATDRSAERN